MQKILSKIIFILKHLILTIVSIIIPNEVQNAALKGFRQLTVSQKKGLITNAHPGVYIFVFQAFF